MHVFFVLGVVSLEVASPFFFVPRVCSSSNRGGPAAVALPPVLLIVCETSHLRMFMYVHRKLPSPTK